MTVTLSLTTLLILKKLNLTVNKGESFNELDKDLDQLYKLEYLVIYNGGSNLQKIEKNYYDNKEKLNIWKTNNLNLMSDINIANMVSKIEK